METRDRISAVVICVVAGALFAVAFGWDESISILVRALLGVFFGASMLLFGVPRIIGATDELPPDTRGPRQRRPR
jgi:TctA family transporter